MLIFCTGTATPLEAQSRYPLVVSGGTHSLTVPWHPGPVTKRLNPALIIGTERTLKKGTNTRLYQSVNLGFFQHYWWMTAVFADTELGGSYALPLGFHADLRLGVGYMYHFWRRETLELKDGVYTPATDWGKLSIMAPLSVVLGYRGHRDSALPVAPFVSAQWAVQGPFVDEAPVMTHFFLLVGIRIDWRGAPNTTGSDR
jgi:hypothetical protein